jgi:hypothetical protein
MTAESGRRRTLARSIDYLGSIRRMLKDLTGYATLAFELIQNADDAPGASIMKFNFATDALVVWNDGQFTDCGDQINLGPDDCRDLIRTGHRCDFHRFRLVSSGDKRRLEDTTGSFGIGFTAVYQITDHPELISNGHHWILDELKLEGERITICPGCEACQGELGTRFILPWARDVDSDFRKGTDSQAVDEVWIQGFLATLEESTPTALLFLRKLKDIDVLVDGKLRRSFTRQMSGDDVLIADGETDRLWRLFIGNFDEEASVLRGINPIEETRTSLVTIALPIEGHVEGLLCAYLPTEDRTALPFHVNADFFPGSDRKHLLTDSYQGKWNLAAVERAATLLAEHLEELPDLLGHISLWDLLLAAHKVASAPGAGQIPEWTRAFWGALSPLLAQTRVMYTSAGDWAFPSDVRILGTREEERALPLLQDLGLRLVHPDLRDHCFKMPRREVLGISELDLGDLAQSLESIGLTKPASYEELPSQVSSIESREQLWRELDTLMGRSRQELAVFRERLQSLALAPTTDGYLCPCESTYRADARTMKLFTDAGTRLSFLNLAVLPSELNRFVDLCPEFLAADAIEALAEMEAADLIEAQVSGRAPSARIVSWFARHDEDFVAETSWRDELVALPIFPSASGPRPLSELALPGDFQDPLSLAELVQLEGLKSHLPFLEALGAARLDLETYVTQFVPKAAVDRDVSFDRWRAVVALLASKLGEIADIARVRAVLEELPLVECSEGFLPADQVYFESDLLNRVLGTDYNKAVLPVEHRGSVRALFQWLGVESTPRPVDVLGRIRDLASAPPNRIARAAVANIVRYLGEAPASEVGSSLGPFSSLRGMRWLPAEGDETGWHVPTKVCSAFSRHLFSSQGVFLDVPLGTQRRSSYFLRALGVRDAPTTAEVVNHLLFCSARTEAVNREVYTFLNLHADEPETSQLRGHRCLLLDSGEYVSPAEVFWGQHPFGRFRVTLGPAFQGFNALLSRLGVKEYPGYLDAIDVLRSIATQFGRDNSPVDNEDDRRVVTKCWRMLEEALAEEELEGPELAKLHAFKCVLDRRNLLVEPRFAFFEDLPGLVKKLGEALASSLITRPEGAWRAMAGAGVRNLSEAVATHLVERRSPKPDEDLMRCVTERYSLLRRALDPVVQLRGEELKDRIHSLRFILVSDLKVRYTLDTPRLESEVWTESALYVADERTLYSRPEGTGRPWMSIAKEIARALCPEVLPGAVAASLALALEPISIEEASARLDEAGLPTLAEEDLGTAAAGVAQGFGGPEAPPNETAVSIDEVQERAPQTALPGEGQAEAAAPAGLGREKPGPQDGETSRLSPAGRHHPTPSVPHPITRGVLRSYVVAIDPNRPGANGEREDPGRNLTDIAGIRRVMEYEQTQGRHPTEMPHQNPGYDIESRNESGEIERYIEVKSLSGDWDSYGAAVTPTQFRKAQTEGDRFWLYVVEHPERSDYQISAIRNPAGKVDQFLFDDGWRAIAEVSVTVPSLDRPREWSPPGDEDDAPFME